MELVASISKKVRHAFPTSYDRCMGASKSCQARSAYLASIEDVLVLRGLSLHPSTVLGRQLGIGLYVAPSEKDNSEKNKSFNNKCISRTCSVTRMLEL